MTAEEQAERIVEALYAVKPSPEDPEKEARALYARGVRVLQLDEVILDRSDAKLLELVRQATERWEEKKASATVSSDESDDTVDVKDSMLRQQLLLDALRKSEVPLTGPGIIRAAGGWHRDYSVPDTEWEPWRDAFRRLVIQRLIRKTNVTELGAEALWEIAPVSRGPWLNFPPTNDPAQLEERRRVFPGLCVIAVMAGPSVAQGTTICGKPEMVSGSGDCGQHGTGRTQ